MKKKQPAHYINNKEFLAAMTEYRESVIRAAARDQERPRVPEYIGECFVKIANHLAFKSNFVNYSFKDEMILDGIECCLTYMDNFDPAKSNNPFAYFTQLTYYAFVRRIQKEKKYMDIKNKYLKSMDLDAFFDQDPDNLQGTTEFLEAMKQQLEVMEKEQEDSKSTNNTPKRRPKYFDEKKVDSEADTE